MAAVGGKLAGNSRNDLEVGSLRTRARDMRHARPGTAQARIAVGRHRRHRRQSHRDQRDLADRDSRHRAARRARRRREDLGRDREEAGVGGCSPNVLAYLPGLCTFHTQ